MPTDQLVGDVREGGLDGEGAVLLLHPGHHGYEEIQVAQLLFHVRIVGIVDRADAFPRLLDQRGAERSRALLAVPGTAVRTAKPLDDAEEARKGAGGVGHGGE